MPNTRRRLDLNTCTVDELELVEGMTRPLAKRIVAYRNRAGNFKTISELGKVRGVGDRMLSLILKHVSVLRSSPRRSRRSSLASSRTNSPQRGRALRSTSRVSFSSSHHSRSPIRKKSPKRKAARPIRRSERVLSRSSLSLRPSPSLPSIRSSHRRTSPKRKAMQIRSTKNNSKSRFRSGPVYVDSAQNVSIDLGKLAKEGCNLILHGGASDGQLSPYLTINVKELDGSGPSVGLSIPSHDHAIMIEQHRSSSPEHPTQTSSVVSENVREVMVIRDTKRMTENFSDPETPGMRNDRLPLARKSPEKSLKRSNPQKVKNHRDRSGDYRKKSRSRSRSRSRSKSSSPKKGSLRRSRSGSRQHSPSRSRRRYKSPANDRLSRSDIENWLQEGSAPLQIDRGGVTIPLASSTPRRRRDKRERRSRSPIAGPSRIEDNGRNTAVVLNRSSAKKGEESGRWKGNRDGGSPRRNIDLEDDDANARSRRRRDTQSIDKGMNTVDRSRGRRSRDQPDKDDDLEIGCEQERRHRHRETRHRSKADRDPRRRRHEETDSNAARSWCSIA